MEKMTVVFTSNYLTAHQVPFCNKMYEKLGDNFTFIATELLPEERKKLGYADYSNDYPYLLDATLNANNKKKSLELANNCDILIQGSAPIYYATDRFHNNQIVFNYCERLFKKPKYILLNPRILKSFYIRHTANRKKRAYVLCASAYTAPDMKTIFAYPNKMFRWGYFPETVKYEKKLSIKTDMVILWVGRFIDWKHPEKAIYTAKYLKDKNYKFKLEMIGTGIMEAELKQLAKKLEVEDYVSFLGAMPANEVRKRMVNANIFLFTSNREEGWGAVLNEAMNSMCAIIASDKIGAVPFLLNDGHNGLIYNNSKIETLFQKAEELINNIELQEKLGQNAYRTIVDLWNCDIAVERMLQVFRAILSNKSMPSWEDGPMSRINYGDIHE